ncbi:hypothetical protein BH20ACT3_BH20ACT3_17730 [soil metagenome]
MGAEPTEVNGPLERGHQRVTAVGGFEAGQFVEVAGQARVPGGRGCFDERLGGRADRAERDLGGGLGAYRPARRGAGPAVVVIVDRSLTRRNNAVFGDHGTQQHDLDHAVDDANLDLFGDVAGRD